MEQQNIKGAEQYCIIRTERAGVFFAKIGKRDGSEAELVECRRLWYWDGAASLSQLAMSGTSKPHNCKFTVTVPSITVFGVIEIIPCTDVAVENIKAVQEWKA